MLVSPEESGTSPLTNTDVPAMVQRSPDLDAALHPGCTSAHDLPDAIRISRSISAEGHTMRKLLTCAALAVLSACGGGGDHSPQPRTIPFSNGVVPNTIGIGLAPSQGSFPEGWYPGCMDCARVLTVAQDRETAERVIAGGTHLPVLDPVDFSKSSVIVFDRVVVGTSYQFRITSIEERDTELTLRSSICVFKDVQIVNGALVGFVVVAKTNKPAVFARSDTTTKPPILEGARPWGEC